MKPLENPYIGLTQEELKVKYEKEYAPSFEIRAALVYALGGGDVSGEEYDQFAKAVMSEWKRDRVHIHSENLPDYLPLWTNQQKDWVIEALICIQENYEKMFGIRMYADGKYEKI